ncbi:MAG: 30S ribosomal protein S2 [Candidatus Levybacteria bacterium GW2011_GWA2_40_8]|nr:MAG: 30S ribosomal protein S2 [Candidatus Levybacteria bacterium GW2011_GWA2_40_8]
MRNITLEELLEAGCHFGHQVTRSNPKARDFIFEAREGVHIIDLGKTKEGLEEAGRFVKSTASKEGTVMVVVGTKRQAKGIIEEEAKKAKEALRQAQGKIGSPETDGLFFVTNRWIGGLLTNFSEVSKNFKKLIDLTAKIQSPEEREKFTKKEVGGWEKERQKLEVLYGGVFKIQRTPDLLFIVDSHLEDLAVKESQMMGVSTVAIVDTNADPKDVDYPIPANDDAVGSIELIVGYIMEAWVEGRKSVRQAQDKSVKEVKEEPEKSLKSEKPKEKKTEEKQKVSKPKVTKTKKTKPASAPAVAKALAGKKAAVDK